MGFEFLVLLAGVLSGGAFAAYKLVQRSKRISANQLSGRPPTPVANALSAPTKGEIATRLNETRKTVSKSKFLIHLEKEGTRLALMGSQLEDQYEALHQLLGTKFLATEITYSRYLSGIESSCLSIDENLIHIKNALDHLDRTFDGRDANWDSTRLQTVERLDSVQEALATLSDLYVKLNQTDTQERHRAQLESSIEEIRRLSDRAKLYERS